MAELDAIDKNLDLVLERLGLRGGRFLSVDGAAAYAGLSADSVRRLLTARKLTAYRPVPGRVVLDRQQLEALVLSSECKSRDRQDIRRGTSEKLGE
jgi:excisionase family DNA binding protein